MIIRIALIFLLLPFLNVMSQRRKYKPLHCDETNKSITRPSLLASCLDKNDCYIVRQVGFCPKKDKVCCVKKHGFDIDENEFFDSMESPGKYKEVYIKNSLKHEQK
ncbi:uncharacterized protein LOC119554854 [Drosophila subpulchrella]|uniref:uncharacterized protein LOC119554854 n=1 Tax=Drosophila subpulchrella TaxID=1486046 RepID=UPI0018A16C77|nr:uncharacterized protein LOC119554854 [Drosophila subpulchrella]